jgi:YD repeat-containing protein
VFGLTNVSVEPGHAHLTTTYANDGVGNVLSKQNPGGSCTGTISGCTTHSYDAANQLTRISYSDGATANVSNIQYDADGQRTATTDGTGAETWHYDSLHRLTSITEGSIGTVSYKYNLHNLATQITYPVTRHAVTQGYDAAARMNSVQDWNGVTSSFNYDANPNLNRQTWPQGPFSRTPALAPGAWASVPPRRDCLNSAHLGLRRRRVPSVAGFRGQPPRPSGPAPFGKLRHGTRAP